MKKIIAFAACLVVTFGSLQAQSYTGYLYNNYEGITGVLTNPANIAGSVYKLDVNIFSISSSAGTNAYEVNKSDWFKLKFSDWTENNQYKKINNSDSKEMRGNIDILGPSIMVAINERHSLGLTTRFRFLVNERGLSNDIFQLFGPNKTNAIYGQTFTQDGLRTDAHAFADIGLTYGGVLFQNDRHKLKAGVTGKWVLGLGAGTLQADNVNVNLLDANDITTLTGNASFAYSTGIDRLISEDLSGNIYDYIDARGFGLDLGVVYEWTSAADRAVIEEGSEWFNPTSYKLRISASVTDIGKLKYSSSPNSGSYMMNFSGEPTDILNLNGRSLDEYINDLRSAGYIYMADSEALRPQLPTLLRANIDWKVLKRLYLNVDGAFNLVGNNTMGARYLTGGAVTPRYESRWFSIYSPVSYNEQKEFGWGVGINVGVFYVGTGTILSNLMSSNIKNTDIHMGIHVPIGRSKKAKSTPTVEQPIYIVAPTPEPRVDTVIQIKEVIVYVEPEPVIEQPKVNEAIVNEVDLLAHSIYFVTGSDWLLIESRASLDKIAEILKAHPDVYATIEGHADSVGSDETNEVLSQQRADRVASYLANKGVPKQRLITESYGSDHPYASNITKAGKAKNRRVEIKLHYAQ